MNKTTLVIIVSVVVLMFSCCAVSGVAIYFVNSNESSSEESSDDTKSDREDNDSDKDKEDENSDEDSNSNDRGNEDDDSIDSLRSVTSDYVLVYPDTWEEAEESSTDKQIFIVPVGMEFVEEDFGENINVFTEDVGKMNIDEYFEYSFDEETLENFAAIFSNYKMNDYKKINVDGEKGYWVESSATAIQTGINLKFISIMTVKDGTAYTITYTADPQDYSLYLEDVQFIAENFEIR